MDSKRTIEPADLLPLPEYLEQRPRIVRDIIALKNRRRAEVGPWVSLVFENRATALYQIQEMVRVEHLSEPEAIQHEIETYSELMPGPGELSATLFIEISDSRQRHAALARLGGIEKRVFLRLGSERVPAFDKRPIDPRFERPGQATAVYYLGFRLTSAQRAGFERCDVWLDIDHPAYRHSSALSPQSRASLAGDF